MPHHVHLVHILPGRQQRLEIDLHLQVALGLGGGQYSPAGLIVVDRPVSAPVVIQPVQNGPHGIAAAAVQVEGQRLLRAGHRLLERRILAIEPGQRAHPQLIVVVGAPGGPGYADVIAPPVGPDGPVALQYLVKKNLVPGHSFTVQPFQGLVLADPQEAFYGPAGGLQMVDVAETVLRRALLKGLQPGVGEIAVRHCPSGHRPLSGLWDRAASPGGSPRTYSHPQKRTSSPCRNNARSGKACSGHRRDAAQYHQAAHR